MIATDTSTQIFEQSRPKLMGIAYRFIGTVSDAEDIVQDVYLKWSQVQHREIDNAEAWLKKVCTRQCLDKVKSVEHKRLDYIGTWLPEPLLTDVQSQDDLSGQLELADSLTTAFLLTLERLSAKERAAFLLHHVFDSPYSYVADVLQMEEANCRKLVSRAKQNIGKQRQKNTLSDLHSTNLLKAFKHAITEGDHSKLTTLLANDVKLCADGGGKVAAILDDICGIADVAKFITADLNKFWHNFDLIEVEINGAQGFIVSNKGNTHAVVSFELNSTHQISGIFIVRNPDKVKFLKSSPIN